MDKIGSLLLFSLFIASLLNAQDIAQWRGPDRNGVYPERDLLDEWPELGPEVLWSTEGIGKGVSSVSIMNGAIYGTGRKDSIEYLSALDLKSGDLLWQIPYGLSPWRSFKDTRCTPTTEGDNIFVISGRGEVVCVDATVQEIKWKIDAYEIFKGEFALWEIAESPLVVDNKVIYTPAGHTTTMVALDKETGETIWTSETIHDTTAYVSPILIEQGDKRIITNVLRNNIIGVDAENGDILWTYNYSEMAKPYWHEEAHHINAITPLYKDGRLFITSGYNHTAVMFELSPDGSGISLAWKQPVLDTHHGGVLLLDGYIYGSTWINNNEGTWACVKWETGELMYDEKWNNKGSIISADNKLFLYEEKRGFVGLVNPNPEGFQLISSFQHKPGSGPHWAHPTISNGILFIRHGEFLTAYKINK